MELGVKRLSIGDRVIACALCLMATGECSCMNYQEFEDKVKSICNVYFYEREYEDNWSYNTKYKKVAKVPTDPYLLTKWVTGGQEGGNCWNSNSNSIYGVAEPQFEDVDFILRKLCPKISYLDYIEINKVFEYGQFTDREYYGNHIDYKTKRITLKKLYNLITDYIEVKV